MTAGLAQKTSETKVNKPEKCCDAVTYTPRVDIVETDDELLLYADLPGVTSEDLDVRFENKELVIEGKAAPRHIDARRLRHEYGVGDFYRTFSIGETIDAEKIAAELNSGVLTVHLPKAERLKPRRIAINAG